MKAIIVSALITLMGIIGAFYSVKNRQESATVGDVFFVGFVLGIIQLLLSQK